MRILLVDDDPQVAVLVQEVLRREGIDVAHAGSCGRARELVRGGEFNALILDVGLPDGNGLDLLASLRRSGITHPVLMLTGADSPEDVVAGLDRGADDYLTKPFPVAVLAARVRALLRRAPAPPLPRLRYGSLELDRLARSATVAGRRLKLTPTEFKLLEYLLLHRGRAVDRAELLESVWNISFDPGTAIVNANITRLRSKLKQAGLADVIATERGSGYRIGGLDPPPIPEEASA